MFEFLQRKKRKPAVGGGHHRTGATSSAPARPPSPQGEDEELTASLEENLALFHRLFADVELLRVKYVENPHNSAFRCALVYCDGMVDIAMLSESLVKPLTLTTANLEGPGALDVLMHQVAELGEVYKTGDVQEIVEAITYGDTALFLNGAVDALIFNTKGFPTRAITEPDNERLLYGPREGFAEALLPNLSMVRRRVRTSDLKVKFLTLGRRTKTKICLCYLEDLVNKDILEELKRRLAAIDIDAVLDTYYIVELIGDKPWSPFRSMGETERPDTLVAKLLEGRVGLLVDGSPMAMTVPHLFIENFQSAEDYYLNFYYSTFSRWLRMIGFFLTITVPGFYISVAAFHHEMFPFQLFVNIASERSTVPLPAALEAFIMVIMFDILREAGARMPSNVGQALSIVGALVIGQAAVQAKLVAAPMIIVVALTGITGMLVPKMSPSCIMLRLTLLALGSCLGFFGLVLGLSALLIHLLGLSSFGVPQLMPRSSPEGWSWRDTVVRAPWWLQTRRPGFAADKTRMKGSGRDA